MRLLQPKWENITKPKWEHQSSKVSAASIAVLIANNRFHRMAFLRKRRIISINNNSHRLRRPKKLRSNSKCWVKTWTTIINRLNKRPMKKWRRNNSKGSRTSLLLRCRLRTSSAFTKDVRSSYLWSSLESWANDSEMSSKNKVYRSKNSRSRNPFGWKSFKRPNQNFRGSRAIRITSSQAWPRRAFKSRRIVPLCVARRRVQTRSEPSTTTNR